MLKLNEIGNGIWISKQQDKILGLELNGKTIKHVVYNIEKKRAKTIIFKERNLYKFYFKTQLS